MSLLSETVKTVLDYDNLKAVDFSLGEANNYS